MYGDNRRESYGKKNESWGSNRNDRGRGKGRSSFGDEEAMTPNTEPIEFTKNFYVPTETLSDREAEALRETSQMKLTGSDIPLPVNNFTSLGFPEEVSKRFFDKGFTTPTPIQAQGWPMALSGRDMVGIASTGSGKTLSFVLPALIHAKAQEPLRENDGPIVLILAPTRELATQIEEVVHEYGPFFNLRSCAVFGGASIVPQKKALKRGVEILVATPGRLIDLHDQGFCPLSRVTFLVLDEADRMLDMGFEPQLNMIIPKTNQERQSLMWSATWPKEVRSLANDYMKNFIQVVIGNETLKCNPKIAQKVEVVEWQDKKNRLLFILQDKKSDRVIIFCNMKRTCDTIEDFLREKGFHAAAIHGDKTQAARDQVIANFKSGRKSILIATDVASRGLDVENVKLVVNYDFPKAVEDYVHRIGRTARGNSTEGHAFTMFSRDDAHNSRNFIQLLKDSNQEIPAALTELANNSRGSSNNSRRGGSSSYGGKGRSFSGGYGNNSNSGSRNRDYY
ncbi:uncharacterized protein LOC143922038 [Arctopsyche grandis]|uniref:uncharacterized protein LOC143922038 n=1 Tax=Arctopsyche grandis TaxID=121162 RepID=UPI00406D646B